MGILEGSENKDPVLRPKRKIAAGAVAGVLAIAGMLGVGVALGDPVSGPVAASGTGTGAGTGVGTGGTGTEPTVAPSTSSGPTGASPSPSDEPSPSPTSEGPSLYASPPATPIVPLARVMTEDGFYFPGITIGYGSWGAGPLPRKSNCWWKLWDSYDGSSESLISYGRSTNGVVGIGVWETSRPGAERVIKVFETHGCGTWKLR
jgi:hypothetical protein